MTDATLLVFAKSPRIGRAKTRLAADLGVVEAQRLNRMCHARAMRAAAGGPWTPLLLVSPDRDIAATHGQLWPRTIARRAQGGGNLGDRLARAFSAAPPGPVAVIGADAPDISAQMVRRLFSGLKGCDAAIGPAHDGGFWGLSVSAAGRRRGLDFTGVRWSTAHAASDVMSANPWARFARLPVLIDLDDEASVMLWRNSLR